MHSVSTRDICRQHIYIRSRKAQERERKAAQQAQEAGAAVRGKLGDRDC